MPFHKDGNQFGSLLQNVSHLQLLKFCTEEHGEYRIDYLIESKRLCKKKM